MPSPGEPTLDSLLGELVAASNLANGKSIEILLLEEPPGEFNPLILVPKLLINRRKGGLKPLIHR